MWALFVGAAFAHGGVDRTVRVSADAWTVQAAAAPVRAAVGVEGERHPDAVARWMTQGLALTAGGAPCALGPAAVTWGDPIRVEQPVRCGPGGRALRDDSLAGAAEQTLVLDGDRASVLTGAQPAVALGAPALGTAARFLAQGAVHLATGYDHVLFLLCLLFVAGPTAHRHGRRAAARQLASIVTAFTLGHSVTLAAAALDVVVLSARWVEAAIAASIVLAGLANALRPDDGGHQRPAVAFAFGLLHGFGFSSVLAEVGLPAGERVLALLSFNVGIELAQLAVVAVAVAPLGWLAAHPPLYRALVMRAASSGIALVAAAWTVQRLL